MTKHLFKKFTEKRNKYLFVLDCATLKTDQVQFRVTKRNFCKKEPYKTSKDGNCEVTPFEMHLHVYMCVYVRIR